MKLPIFQGYTVDVRLKEFRKIKSQNIKFIRFNSIEGKKLLLKYIATLDPKNQEFKKIIKYS